MFQRPYNDWQPSNKVNNLTDRALSAAELQSGLLERLGSPAGTSREWIYQQYDQRVGANTVRDASASVAVVRLPQSQRALGIVLGCRPYVMRMDAELGGFDSVAYPALELSAKGFLPLAVTDCLNFGNPENRNIMSEFVASLESMNAACKAMNTPVISGNVSFYNETLGKNITSTPATGLVGLRDSVDHIPADTLQKTESHLVLIRLDMVQMDEGRFAGEADAETFAHYLHSIRQLALSRSVLSTRVVGRWGLPYALARMSTLQIGPMVANPARMNFSEALYEVLFEVNEADLQAFLKLCEAQATGRKWSCSVLGKTALKEYTYGQAQISLDEIHRTYTGSWGKKIGLS